MLQNEVDFKDKVNNVFMFLSIYAIVLYLTNIKHFLC
jgi:hypothetical protein